MCSKSDKRQIRTRRQPELGKYREKFYLLLRHCSHLQPHNGAESGY